MGATSLSDEPYPLDLDLTLGDLQVKTSGTVTDPAQVKGIDLKLDVRGDNTANLFAISGIALPPSPPYRFSGNVDRRGTEWRVTDGSGRVGGSDMRGTVAVDTGGERLLLKADLVSDNLLAKDMGPFIGARPGGKEGEQAAAEQSKAAETADGKVLPDKEIDLSRLHAMDADVAFKANHIHIPILPFDRLETKMTLDGGTLKLQPAVIRIGDGTVRTDLSLYGSETPVRVDVDTRIERVDLKEFLRGSSFAQQTAGILGGRAQLRATGKSVAQVLGSADGKVFAVVAEGKISHLLMELAGLDIAEITGLRRQGRRADPDPLHRRRPARRARRVHDAEPDLRYYRYDHSGAGHDQHARGDGGRDADSAAQGLQPAEPAQSHPHSGNVRRAFGLHRSGASWREHDDQEDRQRAPYSGGRTGAADRPGCRQGHGLRRAHPAGERAAAEPVIAMPQGSARAAVARWFLPQALADSSARLCPKRDVRRIAGVLLIARNLAATAALRD